MPPRRQAFTWYYLRATGILMIALVLTHLAVVHYASAPSQTTSGFVDRRWAAAPWRAFDWALLVLALTHGVAGVHGMLRDIVRRPAARAALDAAAAAVTAAFLGLGTATIVAASSIHRGAGPLSAHPWIASALSGALVAIATATYLGVAAIGVAFGLRLARREPLGRWTYAGQWAFALNRTAGVGILAFLLVHVLDIALYPLAPDLYTLTVAAYATPYLVPMEAGLVAAVVYHALDGVRLMVLEALDRRAAAATAPSFVAVIVLTVSLSLPALAVLLGWRP